MERELEQIRRELVELRGDLVHLRPIDHGWLLLVGCGLLAAILWRVW